ncbi:iron uptake transporter permease EfeU, partial [Rhodoferax sp.]|uniref:iron uptake transporter permease EfeU n=1 Tax=Rhodoferax sp. TaxID=50421 RepID=UPI00374D3237
SGRSAWMPVVWVGVLLAVALSLFVGAGLQWLSAEFPQKQQEMFEAGVGLIAVLVLTTMVFWMRQAAMSIKGALLASVDQAFAATDRRGLALVGMVFFAVAREGLESVFFLLAVFQQSEGYGAPLGALLGIAAATVVGWGIYTGGMHINLRRFFRWTGIFILFVAAGMLASTLRHLHEAGVWNLLQGVVFDISNLLPMDSPLGTVLAGLFGYQATPVWGEVLAYLLFFGVSLLAFLRPTTRPRIVMAA